MDNVQYTIVNDKEIELLLKSIDICRQWIPVILEGQRRGEFRAGNENIVSPVPFSIRTTLS